MGSAALLAWFQLLSIAILARADLITSYNYTFYSTSYQFPSSWRDISNQTFQQVPSTVFDGVAVLNLPFDFPFFGHIQQHTLIYPYGMLSFAPTESCTGFCNWATPDQLALRYTRYIAPFMTDFDPAAHPSGRSGTYVSGSSIYTYQDFVPGSSEARYTIQWNNVTLRSSTPYALTSTNGFTFQAELRSSGTIVFNYLQLGPAYPDFTKIPTMINMNKSPYSFSPAGNVSVYPITVGLGDSVTRPLDISSGNLDILYTADVPVSSIRAGMSVILTPIVGCSMAKTCTACDAISGGICAWCASSNVCLDALGVEPAEVRYNCPTLDTLLYNCTVAATPDEVDDGSAVGTIAVGAVLAFAVCFAGTIYYFKRKKQQQQAAGASAEVVLDAIPVEDTSHSAASPLTSSKSKKKSKRKPGPAFDDDVTDA